MAVGDLDQPVVSTANATAASGVVVAHNGKRRSLYIENLSLVYDVYLNWGAAAVVGQGRRLAACGGSLELVVDDPRGMDAWMKDAVYAIATGASAALSIEEVSR